LIHYSVIQGKLCRFSQGVALDNYALNNSGQRGLYSLNNIKAPSKEIQEYTNGNPGIHAVARLKEETTKEYTKKKTTTKKKPNPT